MTTPSALNHDVYYHIYNRGNNRENIFIETRNYAYFLTLYSKYIEPVADTFAYCLLRNHFHLLVRIKTIEEIQTFRVFETRKVSTPSQQFGNFFNAYAKAINAATARVGSLFQKPFGRIPVQSDAHLYRLITYIHKNPEKHGFVADFRDWPHSSYRALLSTKPTRVQRDAVLALFGSLENLQTAHIKHIENSVINYLISEDFDD